MEAASRIREVLDVDFRSTKEVWVTQYIRVQVKVQISNPLCSGFYLHRAHRGDTWVQFKYERVFGFRFNCGRLGHMTNTCHENPLGLEEPAAFSHRMMASSLDYRRFSGSNRIIRKNQEAEEVSQTHEPI